MTIAVTDRSLDDVLRRLAVLPVANVGDAMERLHVCDSGIQAAWPGARVCGPAFTVLTRPGDNAFVHAALPEITPGDVVVVAGGGDTSRALIGEILAGRAAVAGVAGFVIDGAIRDAAAIQEFGMPVFAKAVSPAGPYKNGPGALQVPVAIGGVVVRPGDIVIGDSDGVAVVARERAEEIVSAAEAIQANEVGKLADIGADLARRAG